MGKQITIKEISKITGVSVAAVSTALSPGKSNVRLSSKTRERIQSVARELNYYPNIIAQSLNHRKSFLLGFYFNENNWYVATQLIRSIQDTCYTQDYSLIIYPSATLDEELHNLQLGIKRHLDGLLTVPFVSQDADNSSEYKRIAKEVMPVVQVLSRVCPELPVVSRDYRQLGRDAVDYLLKQGHRRIGLLTFHNYVDSVKGKNAFLHYQGYKNTMNEAGLKTKIYSLPNFTGERLDGYRIVDNSYQYSEKIMSSAYAPTALIAASNSLAYGVIAYFREHGMRIPEDISVLGSTDDIILPEKIMPPVTHFSVSYNDIGKIALQKCLDLPEKDFPNEIYLKQVLKEGNTVCRKSQ